MRAEMKGLICAIALMGKDGKVCDTECQSDTTSLRCQRSPVRIAVCDITHESRGKTHTAQLLCANCAYELNFPLNDDLEIKDSN